jgi:GWxTD domain-containing protein
MNFKKQFCLFIIFLAYIPVLSQSIRDGMRQPIPSMIMPVTFETFSTWTSDTASARVQILYRINGGFLFFSRSSNASKEEYTAQAEVVAEILDTLNNTVAREIQPVRVLRSSLPDETDKPNDIQGTLLFSLKPGIYHIMFEAKDSESGKSITNHDTRITIPKIQKDSINISVPLLVERLRNDSLTFVCPVFVPVNRGESISFGTPPPAYIFPVLTTDTLSDVKVHWKIIGRSDHDRDEKQQWSDSTYRIIQGVPQLTDTKNEIRCTIVDSNASSKVLYLPIPFEKIPEGHYRLALSLQAGNKHVEREWHFNILWKNKPRSLQNLDIAINALQHIATEGELSQMRGFLSNDSKKFEEFWKKKNPDTTRAFNPVMTEYYRRVDEAIQKYSSSKDEDGYKTDRGRILILFGHPSRTDRSLKPSSVPTEVWTYEKLRKYFIFTDRNRNGNYELTQAEIY